MSPTLWNESDRAALLTRVHNLRPDMTPAWGRMNATQMITHLNEWMKLATGELTAASRNLPMRYPVIKEIVIRMPWPKGVPTAPELLARESSGWESERADFIERLGSFGKLKSKSHWPLHPAFGRLSTRTWGVLGYKHTDHHLRQFGV
ncbi:MAG TPA: hypothetical protein VM053_08050 [Gemmatimonadaceae bacterium]|nr:hypothetical protein [Gemmatimonadaceae bacterium]